MLFMLNHMTNLCKYLGISLIAGAVTHGAFSESRSMITAAIGIFIYTLGVIADYVMRPDPQKSLTALLIVGVFAALGIGFFTGGVQHFPDSPERSLWVVPTGFFVSIVAFVYLEGKKIGKGVLLYGLIGGAIVLAGSFAAYIYLTNAAPAGGGGHDHSTHSH